MSQENLFNQEAIEKLKNLVDKIDICMLCSGIKDSSMHATPMSRQEVDESGTIWFLASSESETCKNVVKDPHVHLLFSDVSNYNFLSVKGIATVSHDKERIDKYWNKFVEAWFEKGKDDPNIRIIKIEVEDAQYWDNKSNKLVTFIQLASSALTGNKMDIGRTGELNIP